MRALALVALMAACATPPLAPAVSAGVSPALAPFLGEHRGLLRVHAASGVREVPMELHVAPAPDAPDQLQWLLVYGERDRRDYRLVAVDAAAGRYAVDERNGIVLPARLCDGELVSVFAVSGQTLVVRYRTIPGGIEFALEAFDPAKARPAGEGVTAHDGVAVQRATLLRVPAP